MNSLSRGFKNYVLSPSKDIGFGLQLCQFKN
jgi:hypothetical protein